MKALAHFALVALLPAALGAAPVSTRIIAMPLCTGDGQVRSVEVPLEQPGQSPEPCRDKACHGGNPRKKAAWNAGSKP
jgi:hypothetical protein